MASASSFDIVSDFDMQELKNALDQTEREIGTRYDLKDTKTEIEATDTQLTLTTNSEYTLSQVRDLMESKFVRRGLSLENPRLPDRRARLRRARAPGREAAQGHSR